MKPEELIIRFVGGGVIGVLLGMILLVASAQFATIIHWIMGIAFITVMLSSALGMKHTAQAIAALFLLIVITSVFNIPFLQQLQAWLLDMAHTVGVIVVTQTTTSANTAMIFWGIIGTLMAVYGGVTGAREESSREIKRL